jgi:hypothetical protein
MLELRRPIERADDDGDVELVAHGRIRTSTASLEAIHCRSTTFDRGERSSQFIDIPAWVNVQRIHLSTAFDVASMPMLCQKLSCVRTPAERY